jgi:hypothetical protein
MLNSEDPQILEQLNRIQDQVLEAGLILLAASGGRAALPVEAGEVMDAGTHSAALA